MDVHGCPWIGVVIPTGFGYGYSQSGMPPHSQTKEGGYAKFFHLRRPSSNCLETPFRLLDSAVFLGSLVCGKVAALVVVVARACALVVAALVVVADLVVVVALVDIVVVDIVVVVLADLVEVDIVVVVVVAAPPLAWCNLLKVQYLAAGKLLGPLLVVGFVVAVGGSSLEQFHRLLRIDSLAGRFDIGDH